MPVIVVPPQAWFGKAYTDFPLNPDHAKRNQKSKSEATEWSGHHAVMGPMGIVTYSYRIIYCLYMLHIRIWFYNYSMIQDEYKRLSKHKGIWLQQIVYRTCMSSGACMVLSHNWKIIGFGDFCSLNSCDIFIHILHQTWPRKITHWVLKPTEFGYFPATFGGYTPWWVHGDCLEATPILGWSLHAFYMCRRPRGAGGNPKANNLRSGFMYWMYQYIYIYISYICNYKRYYTRYISIYIYIYYWDVPNELNPKCLISAGCVLSFGGALDRSTITVGTIGTLVIIEGAHDE